MTLKCFREDLCDLADKQPILLDASTQRDVGVRLVKLLGEGGMSAVFLAERIGDEIGLLRESPRPPRAIAIKILKPEMADALNSQFGISPMEFVKREVVALQRLDLTKPRSPHVVDYYGCGDVSIVLPRFAATLPWIALEYVPGGVTLAARLVEEGRGMDPLRVARIARGIFEGVRAIHRVGVVHRDLKPENVLMGVSGEGEHAIVSDCGIAKLVGILTEHGFSARTLDYCGIEQNLICGTSNPLIGEWTDVHALAATIWFMIAGRTWCDDETAWARGQRRSLRSAGALLHGGYASSKSLDELDRVLSRAASVKLPGAALIDSAVRAQYAELARGCDLEEMHPRYASVEEFASALDPVLSAIAEQWRFASARTQQPSTLLRPRTVPDDGRRASAGDYIITHHEPLVSGALPKLVRGLVAPFPDGTALARSADGKLVYLWERTVSVIAVGPQAEVAHAHQVAGLISQASFMIRSELGTAMLVTDGILLLHRSGPQLLHPPVNREGRAGPVVAAVRYAGGLAVVTAESESSHGAAQLWTTIDGHRWGAPILVPTASGANILAAGEGAYGIVVVGGRLRAGASVGTVVFIRHDGTSQLFALPQSGVGPLCTAVCGVDREMWAASGSTVVRLSSDNGALEAVEGGGQPDEAWSELGLDPVGCPWLLTSSAIYRRTVSAGEVHWRCVHRQPNGASQLVSLGFTASGAIAYDETCIAIHVLPPDVERWSLRAV